MPTALVTGVTGQDGSYLAEFLLQNGYKVVGMVRRTSTINFERIHHIQDKIELVQGDLLDQSSLVSILQEHRPQEVYNLAAQSFVGVSWHTPAETLNITSQVNLAAGRGEHRAGCDLRRIHRHDTSSAQRGPRGTWAGNDPDRSLALPGLSGRRGVLDPRLQRP